MAEIDVLKAQIVRQDLSTSWGFVLEEGGDQDSPPRIQSLLPGSPAARIGLKCGDEVTEVGDIKTEGLTFQQVQELIDNHGDTLILTVERRARGSVPVNPVMNATDQEPLKNYQPYDMTGAQQHHQHSVLPNNVQPAAEADEESGPEVKVARETDRQPAAPPATAAQRAPGAQPAEVESAAAASGSVAGRRASGDGPATAETEAAPAVQSAVSAIVVTAPTGVDGGQSQRRRRVRTRPVPAEHTRPASGPVSEVVRGAQPQTAFSPPQTYDEPALIGPVFVPAGGGTPPEQEAVRAYQPFDLTGRPDYRPTERQPQVYQFQTVRARPFEEKPRVYYRPQGQSPPPPLVSPQQQTPQQQAQYAPSAQTQQYSPRSYDYEDYPRRVRSEDQHLTQSRTFKVLESLMSSEEPAAGVDGLPPQRTLSQEKWKAEQDAKRGSPRVKVFMPQQYNSPLGMYSAKNVVETFQAQAETVMDAMERHSAERYPMSEVQRALMDN